MNSLKMLQAWANRSQQFSAPKSAQGYLEGYRPELRLACESVSCGTSCGADGDKKMSSTSCGTSCGADDGK